MQLDKLLKVVELANEAAAQERPWSDCLKNMRDLIGGLFANLEIIDLATGQYIELRSTEDLPVNQDYLADYQGRNPRISGLLMPRENEIVHDYQMFDERQIDSNEFYMDFLRPNGLRYFAGVSAFHSDELLAGFSVQRQQKHGNVSQEQLDVLAVLLPHLKVAARTYLMISELSRQLSMLQATYKNITQCVIALDSDGAVISANPAGDNFLQNNSQLIKDGRFSFPDESNQTKLAELLADPLLCTGQPIDVIFHLKWAGPPFHAKLVASTLSPSLTLTTQYSSQAAMLIFINQPAASNSLPHNALQRAYSLTNAELALVQLLNDGATLKEASEMRRVQYDTVRKQLRSVMNKFDVQRQAELTRLLSHLRT